MAPGLGPTSLPEIISRQNRVSVSQKDALSLRLSYLSSVLLLIDPQLNATTAASLAFKILLTESQIKTVSDHKTWTIKKIY